MVSRRVRRAMLIGVLGAAGALLWARREAASEQPICTMPPEDMELQNTVWDAPMDRDTGRVILQAIAEGVPGADLTPTPALENDTGGAQRINAHFRRFWMRLVEVLPTWHRVEAAFRAAGLPEIYATLPYASYAYRPHGSHALSPRAGLWDLLPGQGGLQMLQCRVLGRPDLLDHPTQSDLWIPSSDTFRVPVCAVDERLDLDRATPVAIAAIKATWDEERAQGNAVPLLATLRRHTELQSGVVLGLYALKVCYEQSSALDLRGWWVDEEDLPAICAGFWAPTADEIAAWPVAQSP